MNFDEDFDFILDDFNSHIKYLTAPVRLVKEVPDQFEKELSLITDSEISLGFEGEFFTFFDLYNYLECKFPNLNVAKIKDNHESKTIFISFLEDISDELMVLVKSSVDSIKIPYSVLIESGASEKCNVPPPRDVFQVLSAKSQQSYDAGFIRRDEEFWFNNIESIYQGDFKKSDLYFYDEKKKKCLVDFSVFSNTNLRNHLLLYDEVFCILPLGISMRRFFEEQKLSREDVFYLAEKGRLKIINIQPEFRLDLIFLKEL